MATLTKSPRKPFSFRKLSQRLLAFEWGYLLLGILIGVLLNRFVMALLPQNLNNFLDNLVPEAFGMVFTILILDRLDAVRQSQNIKEQLVRRVHSRYNHTALAAIEELRVMGELEEGILSGRSLRGANWQDANLYKGDLSGADLHNATLFRADFVLTNLAGAHMSDEQFASLDCLYGATMPDGKLYDGRYNLPGDYIHAARKDVDPGSPEEMAVWYRVSLDEYLAGQAWAIDNLPRFNRRSTHYDPDDISNRNH
jgi:hypothetical protein